MGGEGDTMLEVETEPRVVQAVPVIQHFRHTLYHSSPKELISLYSFVLGSHPEVLEEQVSSS